MSGSSRPASLAYPYFMTALLSGGNSGLNCHCKLTTTFVSLPNPPKLEKITPNLVTLKDARPLCLSLIFSNTTLKRHEKPREIQRLRFLFQGVGMTSEVWSMMWPIAAGCPLGPYIIHPFISSPSPSRDSQMERESIGVRVATLGIKLSLWKQLRKVFICVVIVVCFKINKWQIEILIQKLP